jgi:integrase
VVGLDAGTVDAMQEHRKAQLVERMAARQWRHVVAARLGHADPASTLRVYAHVLKEQAAGVADAFAKAVEG